MLFWRVIIILNSDHKNMIKETINNKLNEYNIYNSFYCFPVSIFLAVSNTVTVTTAVTFYLAKNNF